MVREECFGWQQVAHRVIDRGGAQRTLDERSGRAGALESGNYSVFVTCMKTYK
jgi:hypothetical protein